MASAWQNKNLALHYTQIDKANLMLVHPRPLQRPLLGPLASQALTRHERSPDYFYLW